MDRNQAFRGGTGGGFVGVGGVGGCKGKRMSLPFILWVRTNPQNSHQISCKISLQHKRQESTDEPLQGTQGQVIGSSGPGPFPEAPKLVQKFHSCRTEKDFLNRTF